MHKTTTENLKRNKLNLDTILLPPIGAECPRVHEMILSQLREKKYPSLKRNGFLFVVETDAKFIEDALAAQQVERAAQGTTKPHLHRHHPSAQPHFKILYEDRNPPIARHHDIKLSAPAKTNA